MGFLTPITSVVSLNALNALEIRKKRKGKPKNPYLLSNQPEMLKKEDYEMRNIGEKKRFSTMKSAKSF